MVVGVCPHCQQPVYVRHGVRLTAITARIFDVIERAGRDGIEINALYSVIYDTSTKRAAIRVHINKINDLLGSTDIIIRSTTPRGGHGECRYFVARRMVKEVA